MLLEGRPKRYYIFCVVGAAFAMRMAFGDSGAALIFCFCSAQGSRRKTDVTFRDQFGRLMPAGLPNDLHYNTDRTWLELPADDKRLFIIKGGSPG